MIYGLRRDLAVGNRLQELAMFSPTSFRQIISDRILIALFIEEAAEEIQWWVEMPLLPGPGRLA